MPTHNAGRTRGGLRSVLIQSLTAAALLIPGSLPAAAQPGDQAPSAAASQTSQANQVWPADWIESLRKGLPNQKLIQTFETRLGLDWPGNGEVDSEIPFVDQGFVSVLEANLDAEAGTEILALIGRNENFTELAVFRQQGGQWLLAGHAPVYTWYYAPEMGLLATGGPQRSLYVRQLETRGTGIYQESYQFFKLLDGQLRSVLNLPLEARLYGGGSPVNQDMESRFQGLAGPQDSLRVTYHYRFFAGPSEGEVPWESHPESVFLEDEATIDYVWDTARKAYFPDPENGLLSMIQLESIATLEDPGLFARAFDKELRERLKTATPALKKQIQTLLDSVK